MLTRDEMVHRGVMALLYCTSSEVESYSHKLLEGYENDVRNVYNAMVKAAQSTHTETE